MKNWETFSSKWKFLFVMNLETDLIMKIVMEILFWGLPDLRNEYDYDATIFKPACGYHKYF
jgi:hypothetical protein